MGFKSSAPATVFGAPTITPGRDTVTTTASSIVPSNLTRRTVFITKHGNRDIYLGNDASVTTANGFQFSGNKGSTIGIPTTDEIFAIVGSGSEDISFLELED